MAQLKVYSGAAWVSATAKANFNASTWYDNLKFYDGAAWQVLSAAGPAVSASTIPIYYNRNGAGTCYAIVRFNSNGIEYKNIGADNPTMNSSRGIWLDSGLNSEVWVQRTINSGSFNYTDAGSGRLQLSTSRDFGVSKGGPGGIQSCNVTFKFWDAASGGNELDSVTYSIEAEKNA